MVSNKSLYSSIFGSSTRGHQTREQFPAVTLRGVRRQPIPRCWIHVVSRYNVVYFSLDKNNLSEIWLLQLCCLFFFFLGWNIWKNFLENSFCHCFLWRLHRNAKTLAVGGFRGCPLCIRESVGQRWDDVRWWLRRRRRSTFSLSRILSATDLVLSRFALSDYQFASIFSYVSLFIMKFNCYAYRGHFACLSCVMQFLCLWI